MKTKQELLQLIDDLEELQSSGIFEFDSEEDRAISDLIYILQDKTDTM